MPVAIALQDLCPDGFLYLREDFAVATVSLFEVKLLRFREGSGQRDDDVTVCPVIELLRYRCIRTSNKRLLKSGRWNRYRRFS